MQTFKDTMDLFLQSSKKSLQEHSDTISTRKTELAELMSYFGLPDSSAPNELFEIWSTFSKKFEVYWTKEMKQIAKEQFEAAKRAQRQLEEASKQKKVCCSCL